MTGSPLDASVTQKNHNNNDDDDDEYQFYIYTSL